MKSSPDISEASLTADLAAGLDALNFELTQAQQILLLEYLKLLQKWNQTYNLTAIREPRKMVSHHLLDSLAIAPHIKPGRILDVGTGAGLPGIPLAIARPEFDMTMIDSNRKKTAFVQQAISELGLTNARVLSERVESWHPHEKYDAIVSRAFSDMPDFVEKAGHLLAGKGELIAMKGLQPDAEIAGLPPAWELRKLVKLVIPGLDGQRHLAVIGREAHS